MLGLTSWATSIRRIKIQRGSGLLFTHTTNNADAQVRFQKKRASALSLLLKFSNVNCPRGLTPTASMAAVETTPDSSQRNAIFAQLAT